jgi:murein L,D-transpeptidase YafK
MSLAAASFADRVLVARENTLDSRKALATKASLPFPIPRLFLRAYKEERILEVWGGKAEGGPLKLVARYPVAGASGVLGPKLREGDRQVPEGVYFVDRFNPRSAFHLSLGLNYPNARDRKFADKERPGGDIFIHGNTASIGCLAMTDPVIEAIYVMADDARRAGQRRIPVHIFPFAMGTSVFQPRGAKGDTLVLWRDLWKIHREFDETQRVPRVRVDVNGRYRLAGR